MRRRRICGSAIDQGRGLVTTLAFTLSALALMPGVAAAQGRSGAVFEQLIDVDGGGTGLAGCGSGDGNNLTAILGGGGSSEVLADRRDLYRVCDVTTAVQGNGWSGDQVLTNTQFSSQSVALAPEELFVGVDQSAAIFDLQTANLTRRIQTLRLAHLGRADAPQAVAAGRSGEPVGTGLASALNAVRQGLNAGDEQTGIRGLGAFVNGRVLLMNVDDNAAETGSDNFGGGVTAGVDYRLIENLYLGLSFGYTGVQTRYDGSGSKAHLDSYAFTLYGGWFPTEMFYLDGSFAGSILRFDNTNQLATFDGGPPLAPLKSDADGWTVAGDLGAGMEIPAGPLTVNPYARASVLYTRFDAFKQTGGDGTLDLRIQSQENTSLTTQVGLGLSWAISTSVAVVTPHVRADYVHEYESQADDIAGHLVAIPDARFRLRPTGNDRNYATAGGGLSATFAGGFSQFVDYEILAGFDNVTTHLITAGVRFEF